jgi:hypothetical protein
VAACVNLPIVVIHGRQFGFGAFFYVALAHWLLYMCPAQFLHRFSLLNSSFPAGVPVLLGRVLGPSPLP